ncbi:MAG TPA: methylmalonyl-CoA mutase [Acidimicrobiia bacterium]|jgi:methylmalonyl-CoA mutase|nr:methylmalonyl-CoA mutase [Acidimicrobiia bacterium]HIL46468.1 methylmalonyl-CoA mutase [Acidimicrobiia bacterium]
MSDAFMPLSLADGFASVGQEAWAVLAQKVLGDQPLSSLTTELDRGICIQPLYTADDARGRQGPVGSAGWDIRSLVNETEAATANQVALEELRNGATSLLLAGHHDLATVLNEVYLAMAPVALMPGLHQKASVAWLLDAWQEINPADRRGALGLDPLGVAARWGGAPDWEGLEPTVQATTGFSGLRALTVDATVYAEAGAGPVLELAASLATGVAYLHHLVDSGATVDEAFAALTFTYTADCDQFVTMAKLRAARRLWARVAQTSEAGDQSQHQTVVTSAAMLTRQDPWVNLLRSTVAAFSASIGGADVVTVRPFDSALGQPDEFGRRMARNLQLVLAEESSLSSLIDPAGGSWFVENLTDQLAQAAWQEFQTVEAAGGAEEALASGRWAAEAETAAAARSARIADGSEEIIGVTAYPNPEEAPLSRPATKDQPAGPLPLRRWAAPFESGGTA